MDYGGKLAFTGPGIVLGGIFISQVWLLAAGFGLLGIGIVCVRVGWRRGKQVESP